MVLSSGAVGESYNIGGRSERRNIDIVREICRALTAKEVAAPAGGFERLIAFVRDRPGHDRGMPWTVARSNVSLAGDRHWVLRRDCPQTIDWYLANEGWWRL